jgi:hypothetical protein
MLALFIVSRAYYGDEHKRSKFFNATHIYDTESERAYRFEKMHPGEAYFAADPLPALLASGKLYHFDYGVHDRRIAGFPPMAEHVRQFVPPNAKYLIYPPGAMPAMEMVKLLPEYSERVELPEFPMFVVLKRKPE